jgi:beta-glucosidase
MAAGIEAAREADLIVVVIGDRFCYYGEQKSTATLEPMGTQMQLLRALVKLGQPFVIDFIASKPLVLPDKIASAAAAIIQQFSPGMLGGTALGEALVGTLNPMGKLTISIPVHAGQIPVCYNLVRGQHGSYADIDERPRWPFGHGLSYSKFAYSNASLNKREYSKDEDIIVTVTVTNNGPYDGVDIVQVYLTDVVTSVTWLTQELKGFARVALTVGEAKTLNIVIKSSACSTVNAAGVRVVEEGAFELSIGQVSDRPLFQLKFSIV